ncbi:MAG: class I SAM-dependent methyltransferase [Variovorax sp.]
MSDKKSYFEGLYGANEDPYALRTRWYEQRKRAVLMAALPRARYARACEPGCGAAELTVELAQRCDAVLASDFSEHALAAARRRTAGLPNVQIVQQRLPADWPRDAAPFDLIVLSEVGYFLDAPAMQQLAEDCDASLAAGGTLVACDWRPDFAERALPTAQVHAALAGLGLARLVLHEEADFLLQVWCRAPHSVAQREGIR